VFRETTDGVQTADGAGLGRGRLGAGKKVV